MDWQSIQKSTDPLTQQWHPVTQSIDVRDLITLKSKLLYESRRKLLGRGEQREMDSSLG
jgi:hypothetical protein